jgi:hypothetical protein
MIILLSLSLYYRPQTGRKSAFVRDQGAYFCRAAAGEVDEPQTAHRHAIGANRWPATSRPPAGEQRAAPLAAPYMLYRCFARKWR